jgi:hypothetical protein
MGCKRHWMDGHSVISQKTEIFATTAVGTSNSAFQFWLSHTAVTGHYMKLYTRFLACLKMLTAGSTEKLVIIYQTTRNHIQR